jgi:hypothetical protein
MKRRINFVFLSSLVLIVVSALGQTPGGPGELAPERIQEIAGFLPDQPSGAGLSRPIGDRAYWTAPKRLAELHKYVGQAEELLNTSLPKWNDDDYLDYSRTGERRRGEKMISARQSWISRLVYAECVENRGRFLPLLNRVLTANANDPSWNWPAHDGNLKAFHGKEYNIDLRSSSLGYKLAETVYVLGDKLDPAVKELVLKRLEQRMFEPFRRMVATGKPSNWLGSRKNPEQNNWNPVCLSGVVCAALCVVPDKAERAFYVAAGEHYSDYYINSFARSGYCTEGAGYWSYGFGHYALLREAIVQATGGKLDLFANSGVIPCVLYGERIRIGSGVVPPFADCRFGTKIDQNLLAYCNQALTLGLKVPRFSPDFGFADSLDEIDATPCATPLSKQNEPEDPLRSFFKDVGVLACRPSTDNGLGIGIKAGGDWSHSHNDVGSYEIAVGDNTPTGDPGGPAYYEANYFGAEGFARHKLKNSYGHPVPVIGGQLQIDARKAKPVVLSTSFSPQRDEIIIDMTSAYAVPSLKKLIRTMDFTRTGVEQIKLTDEASFSARTTFEDAIITQGDWKQIDATTLSLRLGTAKLIAKITSSADFSIKPEKIEDLGITFTRIGLVFKRPCLAARMRLVFTKAP